MHLPSAFVVQSDSRPWSMQFAGDTVLLAPYSETGAADRIMLVDYDKFQCFDKKS